jgi:hypothetical protein
MSSILPTSKTYSSDVSLRNLKHSVSISGIIPSTMLSPPPQILDIVKIHETGTPDWLLSCQVVTQPPCPTSESRLAADGIPSVRSAEVTRYGY